MAHLSMSDDEMTTFTKDGFGVDSSYSAKDLFEAEAAELPSWLSVRTDLGLSSSAGLRRKPDSPRSGGGGDGGGDGSCNGAPSRCSFSGGEGGGGEGGGVGGGGGGSEG